MNNASSEGLLGVCLAIRPALLRFLSARGAQPAEAEDLVQELTLKLLSQPIGPISDPTAYLYRMANNLFIDRRRSETQRVAREERWQQGGVTGLSEADSAPSIEDSLIDRQRLAHVTRTLAAMPERTIDIFRRFRMEGEAQKDIADILGISVSAVEKHLQRAYRVVLDARAQLDADSSVPQRLESESERHVD